MMMIIIYLIGSVLAYGRAFANNEKYYFAILNGIFSWFGLFIGTIYYVLDGEEKFLRFRKRKKL